MTELEISAKQNIKDILHKRFGMSEDSIQETTNGYCFRVVSSQMGIFAHEHAPNQVAVMLQGIVGEDVPVSPALYEYIAVNGGSWLYGHLNAMPREKGEGTCTVLLRHQFALHYMPDDLLVEAVRKFAGTLEELDDQVVAKFGGHRKYEDV